MTGIALPNSLVAAVAQQAERRASEFKPHLASLLWSISIMEMIPSFLGFIEAACGSIDLSEAQWDLQAKMQLHQFFLTVQYEHPYLGEVLFQGHTRHVATECQELCTTHAGDLDVHVSSLQTQVTSAVRQVVRGGGAKVMEEMLLPGGGGYSADAVVCDPATGEQTAIEVDGPSHFNRALGQERATVLNGKTLLKHRLLRRMGWCVLRVPYYEWTDLQVDGTQWSLSQLAYTRKLLSLRDYVII